MKYTIKLIITSVILLSLVFFVRPKELEPLRGFKIGPYMSAHEMSLVYSPRIESYSQRLYDTTNFWYNIYIRAYLYDQIKFNNLVVTHRNVNLCGR